MTIKSILLVNRNWERFKVENPNVSLYAVEEVEKMLRCRGPAAGFLTFRCPECGASKVVPFACKSRICPRCGEKYMGEWVDGLVHSFYVVSHRYMVFTVLEEFRAFVGVDHGFFRVMMDAVSKTLKQLVWMWGGVVSGVICVFHPFGADLKLNPHVHVFVSEGGLNAVGEWVSIAFFDYGLLWRVWRYHLLRLFKVHVLGSFENSVLINGLFRGYGKVFYVYAKRRVSSSGGIAGYVVGYVCHLAIVGSWICEFNRVGNTVTFWTDVRG